MAGDNDDPKAELIAAAQHLVGTDGEPAPRRFIAALYEHVPAGDMLAREPADLCGAALALWRFAAQRPAGTAKLRVYNPEIAPDGWSSPHTIIETVNDDMPFLVDSAVAAISQSGRAVRLLIHPVIAVARDRDGSLTALDPPADVGARAHHRLPGVREPLVLARDGGLRRDDERGREQGGDQRRHDDDSSGHGPQPTIRLRLPGGTPRGAARRRIVRGAAWDRCRRRPGRCACCAT